jgi:hypothetical protein
VATAAAPTEGTKPAVGRASSRRIALTEHAPIAGLFAGSFVVYLLLALRSPLPVMYPDEFRYAHLARSLADGDGFAWRSEVISQPAALYIYVLTPIWAVFKSTVTAYHLSKVLNCVALSAQVIPVYLLARPLLGRRLALAPAALTVAGTWMVMSAHVITENLGMPFATTALCLTVMTLYRPSRWTGFLALGFALLATWARIQLAVLLPAIAIALALDVTLRPRSDRGERLDQHLYYLAAAAGISLVGLTVALAAPSVVGEYSDLFGDHPTFGVSLQKIVLEAGGLVAAAGFVPVLLVTAVSARRGAWRDRKLGPLLCVFWPAAIVTCVQGGLFLAGVGTHRDLWWGIERYVVYSLPIAFVAVCVLVRDRRWLNGWVLGGAGALGLLLLLHPGRVASSEERAAWGTSFRLHELIGTGTGLSLALAAVVGVGVVALVRKLRGDGHILVVVLAVSAVVLVVQDQAAWHYLTTVTRTFRQVLPADLEWVDHHSHGPVALINLTATDPTIETLDFFNRNITSSYGPPSGLRGQALVGRTCSWVVDATGRMRFQSDCGPDPHAFFDNDPQARMTWQNEIYSASDAQVGRIAELSPKAPAHMRSLIVLPCPRGTPTFSKTSTRVIPASAAIDCAPGLAGELWLRSPGTVAISYSGGNVRRTVTFNKRTWVIKPHTPTTVTFHVPLGQYRFSVLQSWRRNVGNPKVTGVRLTSGGASSSLL